MNVFLGLGLPWMLAVIWKSIDGSGDFKVGTYNLQFSVILFVILAAFAIVLLVFRRFVSPGLSGAATPSEHTAENQIVVWRRQTGPGVLYRHIRAW